MSKYTEEKIFNIIKKAGYSDEFYSIRSSIFMIAIHSELPLKVYIGDALLTDLNERAWDMYIDYYIKKKPELMKTVQQTDNYSLYQMLHQETFACSYFFLNKTDSDLTVKLDMSSSLNGYFSPDDGRTRLTVEPNVIKYLCSSINDPDKSRYTFRAVLTIRDSDGEKI